MVYCSCIVLKIFFTAKFQRGSFLAKRTTKCDQSIHIVNMVIYGSMDRLFHRNVDLTTFQASITIRIFTLIQAGISLIDALPRLHGNIDDMVRHRERFDNFFRMCTHLFTEVFYKFDLFRAFIEEVRTETNRAIEFDANFGTSTLFGIYIHFPFLSAHLYILYMCCTIHT